MKRKLAIKYILAFSVTILLIFGIFIYTYREIAVENSKKETELVAELVRDTLTSYMIMGVIDKRDIFLGRISEIGHIKNVRVVRGESVNK